MKPRPLVLSAIPPLLLGWRQASAFVPTIDLCQRSYPLKQESQPSTAQFPLHASSEGAALFVDRLGALLQPSEDDASAEGSSSSSVLPIYKVIPEMQQCVRSSKDTLDNDGSSQKLASNIVLEAPPGAGKTTMVPLALLQVLLEFNENAAIWMIEPRRVAARSAAMRMASLLGERVGETVGYAIRGETRTTKATRITIATDGVLLNRLQSDPELDSISCVILDEFHERGVGSDTALALCRESQKLIRPDLNIVVMSATLLGSSAAQVSATSTTDGHNENDDNDDQQPFNNFGNKLIETLGGPDQCFVLQSEGRQYPITIKWSNQLRSLKTTGHMLPLGVIMKDRKQLVEMMSKVIEEAVTLAPDRGNILVFMPGVAEIRRTIQQLQARGGVLADMEILPLYGALPKDQQDYAIFPNKSQPERRRIIVATPIAEASLTIEGITCVVDSGLRREARCDADTGMPRLVTTRCSQASATQRAGRAGRMQEGLCLRIYNQAEFDGRFLEQTQPEIFSTDLSDTVLLLAAWGCSTTNEILTDLPFVDPPNQELLEKSVSLLKELGALEHYDDDNNQTNQRLALTPHGRGIATIPAHPRIGTIILQAGHDRTLLASAMAVAFLLDDELGTSRQSRFGPSLGPRVRDLLQFRKGDAATTSALLRFAERISNEAKRAIEEVRSGRISAEDVASSVGIATLPGFIDLVAERKKDAAYGGSTYMLSLGRSTRLDGERDGPEFAVILETSTGDDGIARIRSFASIDKDALRDVAVEKTMLFTVPSKGHEVRARRAMVVGSLELSSTPLPSPSAEQISRTLLVVIRQQGGAYNCLINNLAQDRRQQIGELCSRIRLAKELCATGDEEPWPQCFEALHAEECGTATDDDRATLEGLVEPYLPGAGSLKKVDMYEILLGELSGGQQHQLTNDFPSKIQAPDGSNVPITYSSENGPMASGKLQQFFGTTCSPSVGPANNQLPVALSLLSPAGKPLAQTKDLAFFWKETYPSVRAEMRGRYVKHPWPEDPLASSATRRTNKQEKIAMQASRSDNETASDAGGRGKKKKRGKRR